MCCWWGRDRGDIFQVSMQDIGQIRPSSFFLLFSKFFLVMFYDSSSNAMNAIISIFVHKRVALEKARWTSPSAMEMSITVLNDWNPVFWLIVMNFMFEFKLILLYFRNGYKNSHN